MVVFFTSSNPKFVIYMGIDKFENELLIKWALPIDIWFHVDGYSSAHVYLRMPEDCTMDTIPKDILYECMQLTKDNSKEGKKKDKVIICYTPATNLRKEPTMDIGEVGFFVEKNVKYESTTKDNSFIKSINKTREERLVDFEAEKDSYYKEIENKKLKFYEDKKKKEIEDEKNAKLNKKDKTYDFINKVGDETSNKDGRNLEDDFW